MKRFNVVISLLVLTLTLSSLSAFAADVSVKGMEANSLIQALQHAGARSLVAPETLSLNVNKVVCTETLKFELLLDFQCTFEQTLQEQPATVISRKQYHVDHLEAEELITALKKAGVKAIVDEKGATYAVSGVHCNGSYMGANVDEQCTLKLED